MRHSSSKKADLSLSTNAIVILILAITILGLGLTFVRGLFKQAESKITEVTSSTELANPPTSDNPLTTTPGQLEVRSGKTGKIVVAYLNTNADASCVLSKDKTGGEDPAIVTVSSGPVPVKNDRIGVWTAAVKGNSEGTGIYTFTMICGSDTAKKDVVISVTK